MTFRARLFAAFAAVVAVPLGLLLVGVRAEVGDRLSAQFDERVNALAGVIRTDLDEQGRLLGEQLRALAADMGSDNRFRLALRTPQDRRYLLDYAEQAMRRAGLAMLRIQDSSGRILSSGHFRNEYDRLAPRVARLLGGVPGGVALVRVRLPEGELLSVARAESLSIAGERLEIVGGTALEAGVLQRYAHDPELQVTVRLPGDSAPLGAGDSTAIAQFSFPFMDAVLESAPDTARIVVEQSRGSLLSLRRSIDGWFIGAGLVTLALALAAAAWTSSRISRPLRELAEKTGRLDLDRLDGDFTSDSTDEIGSLSRLLGEMTRRLRSGMTTLREAERRATVGDLARQLNHDIKNGLVPVRNVFRHLSEVARDEPGRLPAVLLERQGTIEAGISYLDNLARNYARLSPALDRQPCDLNAAITDLVRGQADGADIRLELEPALPSVAADPLVIRRILENLVSNALDSLDGKRGAVTVTSANSGKGGSRMVRLVVADEGRGMTERELERAFEDFYTTKEGGTGLGLSIVRRLVLDLNGKLRVETAPGSGTRFIVDLPAVE